MRRLPTLALCIVAVALLAALPAVAATVPLTGTWNVTQTLPLKSESVSALDQEAEGIVLVELMHLDGDLEVRNLSGVFHEHGCGSALKTIGGADVKFRFGASVGVGDWSAEPNMTVRIVYFHYLYDCSGKALGYAWILRTGQPLFVDPGDPDGIPVPMNPAEPEPKDFDYSGFAGWQGQTTIRFFDLQGNPLVLPFVEGEDGVSELSGPFRALRARGEPAR